jgi:hypothetical protein
MSKPLRSTFDSSRFTTSARRQRARERSIRLFIHLFIVVKLLTQIASVLRFSNISMKPGSNLFAWLY